MVLPVLSKRGMAAGGSSPQASLVVTIVDPLAATAPLFTTVFAYFLLGDLERVTRGIVAGAALIVLGVALVTAGPALGSAVGL